MREKPLTNAIHRLRSACATADLVEALDELLEHLCDGGGGEVLTPRQHEVAILVARGCTNGEIARMLTISINAVKKHVSRILVALDVSNRTELAAVAGRWAARGNRAA